MVATVVLAISGILSLSLGYLVHRWRFLPALLITGLTVIAVDLSTRNLTSGGHDDRGLVAAAEFVVLIGASIVFSLGIVLRRWHDRHRGLSRRRLAG